MTQSIETLAMGIASTVVRDDPSEPGIVAFTRLIAQEAALAGIKLGREQAAVVAENYSSPLDDLPMALAMRSVAQAIRALP